MADSYVKMSDNQQGNQQGSLPQYYHNNQQYNSGSQPESSSACGCTGPIISSCCTAFCVVVFAALLVTGLVFLLRPYSRAEIVSKIDNQADKFSASSATISNLLSSTSVYLNDAQLTLQSTSTADRFFMYSADIASTVNQQVELSGEIKSYSTNKRVSPQSVQVLPARAPYSLSTTANLYVNVGNTVAMNLSIPLMNTYQYVLGINAAWCSNQRGYYSGSSCYTHHVISRVCIAVNRTRLNSPDFYTRRQAIQGCYGSSGDGVEQSFGSTTTDNIYTYMLYRRLPAFSTTNPLSSAWPIDTPTSVMFELRDSEDPFVYFNRNRTDMVVEFSLRAIYYKIIDFVIAVPVLALAAPFGIGSLIAVLIFCICGVMFLRGCCSKNKQRTTSINYVVPHQPPQTRNSGVSYGYAPPPMPMQQQPHAYMMQQPQQQQMYMPPQQMYYAQQQTPLQQQQQPAAYAVNMAPQQQAQVVYPEVNKEASAAAQAPPANQPPQEQLLQL